MFYRSLQGRYNINSDVAKQLLPWRIFAVLGKDGKKTIPTLQRTVVCANIVAARY